MDDMPIELHHLGPREFCALSPHLVDIYITAMGYPRSIRQERIQVWREESQFPGFRAVAAVDGDFLVGVAYGFLGSDATWWHRQVFSGINAAGLQKIARDLQNYFEIAEVHIHPAYQGHGVGKALLSRLLELTDSPLALLSTPEVPNEANNAFGLYRSFGFFDVLRDFAFQGDQRPFAILGRRLPL